MSHCCSLCHVVLLTIPFHARVLSSALLFSSSLRVCVLLLALYFTDVKDVGYVIVGVFVYIAWVLI